MARLVVVSGSVGTVQQPNAEVARRLAEIGHDVTFVSVPGFEPTASRIGVDFIGTASARRLDPLEPLPDSSWLERLRATPARRKAVVDALRDDEVARIVAELSPDLVLVEIELAAQMMAMSARGLPLAALTIFPHPFVDARMPALHTTAIPGRDRSGRPIAIRARWSRYHLGLRADLARQLVRTPGDHLRRQYRGLAKALGLASSQLDFDQWVQPLVLRTVPVVSMTAPAFDFPHDTRPDLFDVGTMLLDARHAASTADDERHVDVLADLRRQPERRLVYASFGAFAGGGDEDFIKRLMTAVARRPDWELVVGLGGRLNPDAFGETPPNVRLMGWAPQREILDVADAAVIHGGYSSVHECIRARVPMLFHPFGIDQPGNAARAVHHGLGIIGDRGGDTPAIIESHIEQLVTGRRFRTSLDSMASLTSPEHDASLLPAAIDTLLAQAQT